MPKSELEKEYPDADLTIEDKSFIEDNSFEDNSGSVKTTTISKTSVDLNGDGKVDKKELKIHSTRVNTQRSLAITAMAVMCLFGAYLTVFAPIERLESIAPVLDMFWITMGGVIATYMGAEAYITRRR